VTFIDNHFKRAPNPVTSDILACADRYLDKYPSLRQGDGTTDDTDALRNAIASTDDLLASGHMRRYDQLAMQSGRVSPKLSIRAYDRGK